MAVLLLPWNKHGAKDVAMIHGGARRPVCSNRLLVGLAHALPLSAVLWAGLYSALHLVR